MFQEICDRGHLTVQRPSVSLVGAAAVALLLVLSASTAVAQTTTTVTAAWDRNTDAATAGYMVYYGTSSGTYQWTHDAGNQASAQLTLTRGSVYYLVVRAYNSAAQVGLPSNQVTINLVDAAAPTALITATLQNPTTALVTWSTTNATSATINGATVALSGSQTVPVSATTTFTLVARNAAGATATQSATVTVTPPAAPTAQITATLQNPTTALVTWSTTNAVSARINGATVALSGSNTVAVAATTTFALVATSASGATVTRSATVTVSAAPPPSTGADLQVSQMVGPPPAPQAGSVVPVSVSVTNRGGASAQAVQLTLSARAGAWVIMAFTADGPGCVARDGSTYTCALGTLAAGQSRTFNWRVRTKLAGTLVTTATVTSATADPVPANNSVALSTVIASASPTTPPQPPSPAPSGGSPDVSLTSALTYGTSASGPIVRVRVTVRNHGTATEPAVQLAHTVTANPWVVQAVSAIPSLGSCQGAYHVSCAIGSLAPGGTAVVDLTLLIRLPGSFSLRATATGTIADPVAANNVTVVGGPTIP